MKNYIYSGDNPLTKNIQYTDDVVIRVNNYSLQYNIKDGDTLHVVKSNDTLEELAREYYDDSRNWVVIAMANKIIDPFNIELGTELIIPLIN